MSCSIAPANISSPDDLIGLLVSHGEPVEPTSKAGYAERYIHSECYRRYPGVNSVIHSHSEAVMAYSVNGVPLKPIEPNLLVTNTHLGEALAATLGGDQGTKIPNSPMALMRGHGFTIVAERIIDAVVRAVYAQKNAVIQTPALTTNAAHGGNAGTIIYLSKEEIAATEKVMKWSAYRPWGLWAREVEAANLYINLA
ncbi:hypothetical protein LTR99_011063 [Exophiala xenobiotica]|uniref:Class II aldolase/adducin N-terminal domain-containing protein n=1 Tax=Vermiconidia calcicola TaxID=1690605 RepID=A0AAV9PTF3_9PEZI|nr:hypothetical protein LTR92_010989 [Exophiala xenobiotica]KAK5527616.1 hypothetical protein LTR25_011031 [Vermiconidia calcicola]KAK5527927.1 hypothetical protein LTR23_011157 [Chaetothyriales sp. CCFEE 6169]KAK5290576.1 hypothetical protein LTR99_011063 [Exophiala xenobiotica]KAK5313027.1 hypothetical protein LTR93_011094 [Exophiala xenobiotica]